MRFHISFSLIFTVFLQNPLQSQNMNNAWVDMFSYLNIKNIQAAGSHIYAQAENAFFIYHANSREIEKFSSINGLTGDKISGFYYHNDLHKLFVFHIGGLIEVVDNKKNVYRSPELAYNHFIPIDKKELNDIAVDGDLLYLATKYGISVYNLRKNEFGDTFYFWGNTGNLEVKNIAVYNHKIFAATTAGLYYANTNANLIDTNVWTKIDNSDWNDLAVFNHTLLGIKGKKLYKITSQNQNILLSFNENISKLHSGAYLSLIFSHHIESYNENFVLQHYYNSVDFPDDQFSDAVYSNDYVYIGTEKHGMLQTPFQRQRYTVLHPDSPLSNHAYAVDAQDGILWLAYGDHTAFNPYPLYKEGLSSYQNKTWINIPYNDFQISDICFVKINPVKTDEVYFASVKNGLIRVRNNQIDKIYNQNNSPLQMLGSDGIRVYAMDFDSQNNLWVTQIMQPSLLKLKPDDNWETIDLSNVLQNPNQDYHGFSDMKIDADDNIWFGTDQKGLIGYNQKTQDIRFLKTGLQSSAYPVIQTLDIDKDNILWAGNREGLRVLSEPQQIFNGVEMEFKPVKVVFNDVVQLLMEGQNITKIRTDGANNKWIATLGSGVYYFNEDGTQTIYHFTKENSPLPSDDVYDIAIDGSNGMVYLATLKGLIGYQGFATEGNNNMDDVYAFPNPANEKHHDYVTIRGLIEGVNVKIVDIEGNLVYETTSKGGSIRWDLTAFGKYKVASGVYVALITNDDGTKTQTTKILVIK